MPTVAPVRLRYSSQDYWFDPNETGAQQGDHVVVDTARGAEIGLCVSDPFNASYEKVKKPLKSIVRVATDDDLKRADELAEKGRQAMGRYRELIEEHKLEMKPVDVDYLLDGSSATFYFTSEGRVDFRSLVRDLSSEFHVRVDMRQIGDRDEARMLGGLGHCGEELCCARIGGDFKGIGIRMAKEQDLPLNPTKISGLCGRLMCCLRYEFDAYKEFKTRAPKKNALIDTPLGLAKVVEFDTPHESVRVRFEDGKSAMLPVSAMDTGDKKPKEGERVRPCHISAEKFDQIIEELNHDKKLSMMGDKLFSDNPELSDKTAEAGAITRTPRSRRKETGKAQEGKGRRSRTRSEKGERSSAASQHTRKRRRSVSVSKGDAGKASDGSTGAEQGAQGTSPQGGKGAASQASGTKREGGRSRHRRSRRSGDRQGANRQQKNKQAGDHRQAGEHRQEGRQQASKPRPGQHSSTVSGDATGGSGGRGRTSRRRHRGSKAAKAGGSGKSAQPAQPSQPRQPRQPGQPGPGADAPVG